MRCSRRSRLSASSAGVLIAVLTAMAAAGLVPVSAQAPEEPSPPGVIRVTVNLVQVDAVVTDSKGHQVTDLRPEDFEILEDGRPQTITNFSYISIAALTRGPLQAQLPPQPPGAPSVPPVRLRPEQVRRTIAIVVDDLTLSPESILNARKALKNFVDEDVQPGDLVAILRTASGLGALQQFTNDKRLLYAAIDRIRFYLPGSRFIGEFTLQGALGSPEASGPGDSSRRPVDEYEGARRDLEAAGRQEGEFRQRIYSGGMLGALDYVVAGLRDLPGRKSLVLVSDGTLPLPPEGPSVQEILHKLVDLANRSSVVLYTLDMRGFPTLVFSGNNGNLAGGSALRSAHFGSQGGMNYLAKQTGGLFVHDTNDLAGGIREILDDQSGYYLIGHKPPPDIFKLVNGARGYHQVEVKVKVPGLQVRSRTGFYGIPDEEARPVYHTRDEQLRAAVTTSPFGAAGVHVQLAAQFVNGGRKDSIARLWLHIDASDLTLQDAPGGTKKAAIDLLALTFDDNGAVVNGLNRTFTGSFAPYQLGALRKLGVNYRMDVPIKQPGGYQLRMAVRDTASERVGSASEFIEIPDVGRGRLTLSGIVLNAGGLGESGPAVRRFRRGDRVTYRLEIYNARRGPAKQAPDLEGKIQIFRDGRLVTTLNAEAPKKIPWSEKRLAMYGELTLGPEMTPGDYALQVTVTDKLAPPQDSVASQWIDFEIAGAAEK
ncbi:MAG: VWA domain-containing protein [Acidobacteriia bacterium]|nr:VWA domain-containing protein [Terriglobia bacterium]